MKNYSSHLIGENKVNIVEKVFSSFLGVKMEEFQLLLRKCLAMKLINVLNSGREIPGQVSDGYIATVLRTYFI
jgi:hypothetical protein